MGEDLEESIVVDFLGRSKQFFVECFQFFESRLCGTATKLHKMTPSETVPKQNSVTEEGIGVVKIFSCRLSELSVCFINHELLMLAKGKF